MSLELVVFSGVIAGLLVNYFSDVLPVSRRITRPLCRVCSQPYSARDYLLSNRCSKCKSRKSIRFFIVLLCAIGICILLNYFPFSILGFWATIPILIFLGVILVIDIEHRVVLVQTSIIGFGLFLIYGIVLHDLRSTLFGSFAGFLIMFIFFLLGLLLTKIIGKLRHKEINEVAFGFGDVLLGTVLGLLTGWPLIGVAILISILAFVAFSFVLIILLLLTKKYHAFSNTLPFTTFLILGAIAVYYL